MLAHLGFCVLVNRPRALSTDPPCARNSGSFKVGLLELGERFTRLSAPSSPAFVPRTSLVARERFAEPERAGASSSWPRSASHTVLAIVADEVTQARRAHVSPGQGIGHGDQWILSPSPASRMRSANS
jgi:hypothetical protein